MLVYESDYISYRYLPLHKILLSKWKATPIDESNFKSALLKGTEIGNELGVKRSVFDQEDFQFIIPPKLFSWINEEINLPSFRNGVEEVAFVLAKNMQSQFSVMDFFNTDIVYSPKYFSHQDEAIDWFNKQEKFSSEKDSIQDTIAPDIRWHTQYEGKTAEIKLKVSLSDLPAHLNFLKKHTESLAFKQANCEKFRSLTNRERIILKQLVKGLLNKEIAEDLIISEQTVKTHRKNINRKLNTHHLIDLYEYAIAFELV